MHNVQCMTLQRTPYTSEKNYLSKFIVSYISHDIRQFRHLIDLREYQITGKTYIQIVRDMLDQLCQKGHADQLRDHLRLMQPGVEWHAIQWDTLCENESNHDAEPLRMAQLKFDKPLLDGLKRNIREELAKYLNLEIDQVRLSRFTNNGWIADLILPWGAAQKLAFDYFEWGLEFSGYTLDTVYVENLHITESMMKAYNQRSLVRVVSSYEIALNIARLEKKRQNEGIYLSNLAVAHAEIGDYQKAIYHYKQAQALFHELRNLKHEGIVFGNMGTAFAEIKEFHKGIICYEKALSICRDLGDREGEGIHLGNLANIYHDLNQPDKGVPHLEQAISLAQESGDLRVLSIHLGNLANIYIDLKKIQKAVELYEQAVETSRDAKDLYSEGVHLVNLGILLLELGSIDKARRICDQLAKIVREVRRLESHLTYLRSRLD